MTAWLGRKLRARGHVLPVREWPQVVREFQESIIAARESVGEESRGHAQPLVSWWLRSWPAMRTAPASPHATIPDRARTGVQHRPLSVEAQLSRALGRGDRQPTLGSKRGISSLAIQFDASADGLAVHAAILQRLRERVEPPMVRPEPSRSRTGSHLAVVGMYGRCDLGGVVPAEPGESVGVWNETLTAECVISHATPPTLDGTHPR